MARVGIVVAAGALGAVVLFQVAAVCARDRMLGAVSLSQRIWIDDHLLVAGLRNGYLHFNANEIGAMSGLRSVARTQAEFQAAAFVDEDHDGTGEFATFRELLGAVPPRGGSRAPDPPLLRLASDGVRGFHLDASGEVTRDGYVFRMWLPGRDARFVTETADGLGAGVVAPDAAESRWRCYAWPISYDWSGIGTYFVDETGEIYATDDPRCSGCGSGPKPDAATERVSADAMSYTGADGNVWRHRN
jgi:hypothetical protein